MFSIGYTKGISTIFEKLNCFDKIHDVYYSLPLQIVASARAQSFDEETFNELMFIKEKGIRLHLVINGYSYDSSVYSDDEIKKLIDIIKASKADILTFSNTIALKHPLFKELSNQIEIKNSINNKVKSIEDVRFAHKMIGLKSLILDRSLNRDFDNLIPIMKYCNENNITTTLLVNEGCIPGCLYKAQCDNFISSPIEEALSTMVELTCGGDYREHPALALKSPFILPGQLNKYIELGVDYFKIASRGKPLDEVEKRIRGYVFGDKSIGLRYLLDTNPHQIFYKINTNMLEDYHFTDNTFNCKNSCSSCNFCDIIFEKINKELL
jgi:collagenase-like PrtC family protease